MKKTIIAILLAFTPFYFVAAQHLTLMPQGSAIQFTVENHMIIKSTVTGTLQGLTGNVVFDPQNLKSSVFDVSVQVETIHTGIGLRDNHIKEENYFNAPKFPLITIKSESLTKAAGDGQYNFNGTLTMKGVTKPISFPFTAIPVSGVYHFRGHFQLNRMDYGLGPDNSIDKIVDVGISVLAK